MKQQPNPFKMLGAEVEAPPELKDQVMGSIGSLQLLADLADLFTHKAGRTLQELWEQPDQDADHHPDNT